MVDSPLIPVGRRPRRSFLEPGEDDPAYRQWLIEKGHVDLPAGDQFEEDLLGRKTGRVQREGSTFMEVDDPTQPGGKRYVARRNSQVDMPANARVMSFKDGFGNDKPFVTEDKLYRPTIAPSVAARYSGDYAADERLKRAEAEREKARAERLAEEERARQARLADRREMGAIDRENLIEQTKAMRELDAGDPRIMRRQELEIGALEEQAERAGGARARRRSFLSGDDIPGVSRRGEEAGRAAIQQGADTPTAEAMARRAHEADVAEIQRLEESGDPDAIAQAQMLRESDPDLQGVRSFLTPGMGRQRQLDQDFAIEATAGNLAPTLRSGGGIGSGFSKLFGGDFGGFFGHNWADAWGKLAPEEQMAMQDKFSASVLKLRQQFPTVPPEQLRSLLEAKLRAKGVPQERIAALLSGG